MEHIFTYPKDRYDNGELSYEDIKGLVLRHESMAVPHYQKLHAYYMGHHTIEDREKDEGLSNNKPVSNHAKDISDIASGYFLGSPIDYKGKNGETDDVLVLRKSLQLANARKVDESIALNQSIYGVGYDYAYRKDNRLMLKDLDPRDTFIVQDDTIEHNKLFGVNYYKKRDDAKAVTDYVYTITVATESEIRVYHSNNPQEPIITKHGLGYVPIVEYRNNAHGVGDFEQQIGLIDCYNTLMADRVNDKEQFVDSILAIYGSILGDDTSQGESVSKLQKYKLLELDSDAKAEYLTHTLDENGTEVLRKALKNDIYTFSHVPNLADENFAGNTSGIAMEYKLLGLEMLTKVKELWFREGLMERLRIFIHDLALKGILIDETDIEIGFSRGLPKNTLELSQIIVNLADKVSLKTLISQLPFVEDAEAEIKALEEQQKKMDERELALNGFTANNFDESDVEDDE